MEKLGVWSALQERLVLGENIAQAYQFVSTGNAELGFVAYSQIREPGKTTPGSFWLVPQTLTRRSGRTRRCSRARKDNAAGARVPRTTCAARRRCELIRAYGYDLP